MRPYVTSAALTCLLAAGGCSARHSSDSAAASPAATGVATPAPSPAALAPALATTTVPAELPPPPSKKSPAAAHKPATAARRVRLPEDPRRIPRGISYDEMVRRFGPPSIVVTDGPSRSSLSYTSRSNRVQVEIQDGHVISVASSSTGR